MSDINETIIAIEDTMTQFMTWLMVNSIKEIEQRLNVDVDTEYNKDGLQMVRGVLEDMSQDTVDILFKDWNDKSLLIEAVETYQQFRRETDNAGTTEPKCSECGAC